MVCKKFSVLTWVKLGSPLETIMKQMLSIWANQQDNHLFYTMRLADAYKYRMRQVR